MINEQVNAGNSYLLIIHLYKLSPQKSGLQFVPGRNHILPKRRNRHSNV